MAGEINKYKIHGGHLKVLYIMHGSFILFR